MGATMNDEVAAGAAALLAQCRVAALGTLHEGAPAVSMTPYAIVPAPFMFVVLVSGLSAHTRDMQADPRVALLIMEPEHAGANVHALARISVQGEAEPLPPEGIDYAAAHAAYLARFPSMAGLFDLGDFALYAIRPTAVRVVAGFAQAHSLTPATLAGALTNAV